MHALSIVFLILEWAAVYIQFTSNAVTEPKRFYTAGAIAILSCGFFFLTSHLAAAS